MVPWLALSASTLLAVLLFDLPGDLGQATHGIDAHDAACQVQLLQQHGQRCLLIGMLLDMALSQHQVRLRGPRAHHLDRGLAHPMIMGTAGGLAINGDLLGWQDRVDRLDPREKTRLKLFWVQRKTPNRMSENKSSCPDSSCLAS